jgi:acyl-[acyl carrier protein]--UDP-N-acetylglucosamine O-acyltransferase
MPIHPTAIINPQTCLGEQVSIGPYVITGTGQRLIAASPARSSTGITGIGITSSNYTG